MSISEQHTEADDAALEHLKKQRDALAQRLIRDDEDELADVLIGCGQPMQLTCTCCGRYRMVETRCKKRWCPVCSRQISAKRVAKYVSAVECMQWPLFLTLTRPNVKNLELTHIKHLRRAYRKLRQQRWWSSVVIGGIASLEITNTGRGWHPHIHSIIDCRWLAKTIPAPRPFERREAIAAKCKSAAAEVAALWAKALDLPRASIHVKRAYTDRVRPSKYDRSSSIAVEVLKYSVKSADLISCAEPIGDLIRLMGAARLVSSWGSCYGKNLGDPTDKPYTGSACDCGAIGSWLPDHVVDRIAGRPRRYT